MGDRKAIKMNVIIKRKLRVTFIVRVGNGGVESS